MYITRSTTAAALCLATAIGVATSGCGRKDATAPVPETQTQTSAQGANVPTTVIGCVRASEASDTFVLTTAGEHAVTYHLAGEGGGNLRDHVGRQVEVSGAIRAEQRTASQATTPANAPTGTAGDAQVRTQTQVNVRTLDVTSVRPTGAECN